MARLDVYRGKRRTGLLLDVQAYTMRDFDTRVVIPLIPASDGLSETPRL